MRAPLKSVDQALALMEYIAGTSGQVTVTGLSRHFGWSKATVHRLLSTLRARGYVIRDPLNAHYSFGLMATQLTQQAQAGDCLTHACWPAMKWLSNSTEETVLLAVREGDRAVIVEKLDSPRAVFSTQRLGRLLPVHTVSTGMALLASLPDVEIRELLAGTPGEIHRTHPNHTRTGLFRGPRGTHQGVRHQPGAVPARSLRGGRPHMGRRYDGDRSRRSQCAYLRLGLNSTSIRCASRSWRRLPRHPPSPWGEQHFPLIR